MVEILRFRHQAQIDEEAATWVWRLDSGGADAALRAAFDEWLQADPRHQRAFDQLSGAWQSLGELASGSAVPTPVQVPVAHRQRRWLWAAAAALLIAIGAGLVFMGGAVRGGTLATAVGQQQEFKLADGSVLMLNTNSIVDYQLRRGRRELVLRKGEAHFQVAHDGSRPFYVRAGDAVVRAVGTKFDVHLRSDNHVDVLVDEGRVEVSAAPAPATTAASAVAAAPTRGGAAAKVRLLSAGEGLTSGSDGFQVIALTPQRMDRQLAWRSGAVMFDGEPLSQAVEEISRYSDARVIIRDPRVAEMRFGGRFRTDDLEGFLAALQGALPVTIRHDAGVIYIEMKD